MKTITNLTFCCILLGVLFWSCNPVNNEPSTTSKLIFKTIKDSILFTGTAIKSYNNTTKEIIFNDSNIIKKIKTSRKVKCYLDNDSLFTFTYAVGYMSAMINDLVLYDELYEAKYYFEDGYPAWQNDQDTIGPRYDNKQKRAVAWAKFIAQLKLEGRYKQ